jgi:hypothetical protein
VVLTPQAGIEMDTREGQDRAEHEMQALLAVLGSQGAAPILFRITDVGEVETSGRRHATGFSRRSATAYPVSKPGPEGVAELVRQVRWAAEDLLYRALLVLLLLARRAKNPRPMVFNMVERLATKYGGRPEACRALGVEKATLTPVVRDQGEYDGDRHAYHPVGATRSEIPDALRSEVIDVATRLVRAYEAATWPSI